MKRWDILGLGCVAVDDLLYVVSYPAADSKIQVQRRERQAGGQTGTALVAAARLGAHCAYAGTLGFDAEAAFLVQTFEREGIDLQPLRRRDGVQPIHCTIVVAEDSQTRTVLFDLAGTLGATEDHPPEEVIRASKVLYVDHYGIGGMTRAARCARAANIPVVADLEFDQWPGFADLLALCDHVIINKAFAAKLTGKVCPAEAIAALWTADRAAVVITAGAQGCWYRGTGSAQVHHQPAFAVEVVDSTGCGDVFHGAYAAALAEGMELTPRIRFATCAAGLKATRSGGQAGIPTRAEVNHYLHSLPPSA